MPLLTHLLLLLLLHRFLTPSPNTFSEFRVGTKAAVGVGAAAGGIYKLFTAETFTATQLQGYYDEGTGTGYRSETE